MNEEINYFKINHLNEMRILSSIEKQDLMINLYSTIVSVGDDKIRKEINKYFNKIIPSNNSDKLKILSELSKIYSKKFDFKPENYKEELNTILGTDYNMSFKFDKKNTENVSHILVYLYTYLIKNKNQYEITEYNDILNKSKDIEDDRIDLLPLFKVNKEEKASLEIKRSKSLIPSEFNMKYKFIFTGDTNEYYPLPIEMIVLINKFSNIKKLYFLNDDLSEKKKYEILIILLNLELLFPNLFELEFDLGNDELKAMLDDQYKDKTVSKKTTRYGTTFKSKCNWEPISQVNTPDDYCSSFKNSLDLTTHSSTRDRGYRNLLSICSFGSSIGKNYNHKKDIFILQKKPLESKLDKDSDKESPVIDVVKKQFAPFENIIIYSYFITKIRNLKILSINFEDCFSYEIEDGLKRNYNVNYAGFHFLKFFTELKELLEINIEFNSLDIFTFEKILNLIHENHALKRLRLSFFSSEDNYSPSELLKLCHCERLNYKSYLSEHKDDTKIEDFDQLLISFLSKSFSINMNKLFFLIQLTLHLTELNLYFDIPSIIANKDFYVLILMKFIFNVLILLSYENHSYNTVKIIAPYLKFNSKIYPIIDDVFEEIDLNNSSNTITNFTFQISMCNIPNVANLISNKFQYLFLGDLDKVTFNSFIDLYTSKDFLNKSQLIDCTISLNNTLMSYDIIYEDLFKYLTIKPLNLQGQSLLCYIKIQNKDKLINLFDIVYCYNKVNKTYIQVGKSDNFSLNVEFDIYRKKREECLNNIYLLMNTKKFKYFKNREVYLHLRRFLSINENRCISSQVEY